MTKTLTFVQQLARMFPEAFDAAGFPLDDYLDDDDVDAYAALGRVRTHLEQQMLQFHPLRHRASVRLGCEQRFAQLWGLIEEALLDADDQLKTVLMIELFEGVGWTEDVLQYLGPRTRELLREAQSVLQPYNDQIGRWG